VVAAVVAVIGVGGGLTLLLRPHSPPVRPIGETTRPDTRTAAAQAAQVNELLASHEAAGLRLTGGLSTCEDVAASGTEFEAFIRNRQEGLPRARALRVDVLPDGAALRAAIIDAYQSSLDADEAYLAWSREVASMDCGPDPAPRTANFGDAVAGNDRAGPAKRRVVALWTPIAQSQGLPVYAWQDL
jgi:hypothetical protein